MNKTNKNGTFTLRKSIFRMRGGLRYFLKQLMMIGNEYSFVRNFLLFEYVLSVLIVADILVFPDTSRYIPASWNNIKSPLILHRQI